MARHGRAYAEARTKIDRTELTVPHYVFVGEGLDEPSDLAVAPAFLWAHSINQRDAGRRSSINVPSELPTSASPSGREMVVRRDVS